MKRLTWKKLRSESAPLPDGSIIRNIDALPRGTGARYLECITSRDGILIAKAWRVTVPPDCDVLIDMTR